MHHSPTIIAIDGRPADPTMAAALAADCREAIDLLRQYADLTKPDGSDWALFVRIEQIINRLYMNREVGASMAVKDAYDALQTFVAARLRLAKDEADWHSPQNYYPAGNPIRVRAEASNAERRKLLTGYAVRRPAIFARLEAELVGFGVTLAPAQQVAA